MLYLISLINELDWQLDYGNKTYARRTLEKINQFTKNNNLPREIMEIVKEMNVVLGEALPGK